MKTLDELSLSADLDVVRSSDPVLAAAGVVAVSSDCRVEVDRVTETEWSQLLERFADANVYQGWSYGATRWGQNNLSHIVLKRGSEVLGQAQLRIVCPGRLGTGIAYLRWGPLCHLRGQSLDPATVAKLVRALRDEYVEKRGLFLEILPNAYSGSLRAQVFESAFADFDRGAGLSNEQYRTLVLDLSPSLEDLRKNLDKKWRNQLSAAERKGLAIVEGSSGDAFRRFCALYRQMWRRKKFHTNVSIEEFEQIQERLPEPHKMRVLICEHEGEPVAGLVCSAIGESAIYLLGATNDEGMKVKASYLLQWATIQRLKESGIRSYDLGGIDPEINPGVYHFKSGLSGADVTNIDAFSACDNGVSAALVRAGQVVRNGLQGLRQRFGA